MDCVTKYGTILSRSLFGHRQGNFPLNHDVILKVCYYRGSSVRKAYFSIRSTDTGVLCDVISKLPMVRAVEIVPVELINDIF